jgi:ribulose-5-phosphate 4-epimerase/fuculose-1-phosphate aldolase
MTTTTTTNATGPAELLAERDQRRRDVAAGYRILASYGWGDDGSGHISARDPEHIDSFWLLRHGVAFAAAEPDDLVLVGPDGSARDGIAVNWAAYCIHHPIHDARPDVVGVVHTHTGYGTPFAARCVPLLAMSQEACAFHDDQALFDGDALNIVDLDAGGQLAAALGPNRLVVLANHGLLTVGATVGQAVGFFVLAERAAEVQVKSPGGRVIDDAAAQRVYASIGAPANGDDVFAWLQRTRLAR